MLPPFFFSGRMHDPPVRGSLSLPLPVLGAKYKAEFNQKIHTTFVLAIYHRIGLLTKWQNSSLPLSLWP